MKVIIKNLQKRIPISPIRVKETVLRALELKGAKIPGEITICFVSDKAIREFNLLYLAKDSPTDVIAFDNSNKKNEILADILVSADTAVRNAGIFKTTPLYELYLYVVHGVLHLLGYNDTTLKQKKIMREKELFLLGKLKLL